MIKNRLQLGFQSIGVTNKWRRHLGDQSKVHDRRRFPINRRHQQVATVVVPPSSSAAMASFQSIGVTNKWRHPQAATAQLVPAKGFQSIGVTNKWRPSFSADGQTAVIRTFPINRRHQQVATESFFAVCHLTAKDVSNQ